MASPWYLRAGLKEQARPDDEHDADGENDGGGDGG
jgi:hypothetical protein